MFFYSSIVPENGLPTIEHSVSHSEFVIDAEVKFLELEKVS